MATLESSAHAPSEADLNNALQHVLKNAFVAEGLAIGLREAVKSLDRRDALLCILANNCDCAQYVRLVEALCAEHGIRLMKVDDNKKLGEWVGLCKLDRDGKPRKVVACSCAAITKWGVESAARDLLLAYVDRQGMS